MFMLQFMVNKDVYIYKAWHRFMRQQLNNYNSNMDLSARRSTLLVYQQAIDAVKQRNFLKLFERIAVAIQRAT